MSEVEGRTEMRTTTVGSLNRSMEGEEVILSGWVHRRRDLGGVSFLDLRDRTGLAQVSLNPDWTDADSWSRVAGLGQEWVVQVRGVVAMRPDPNPTLATGEVEVRAAELRVLNPSALPPIPVYYGPEEDLAAEELRLRHRVLDLRRDALQSNLILRHRLILETRKYLDREGFLEIETPILTKPTPEGARDYLVPSRVHPGQFFALPQSPQLYKQILMVAGFDRYFQIARCFRDEDLRADRQPEFTQIDLEASFVGVDDILGWMEGLMVHLAETAGIPAPIPFPRLTHSESMERYGTDRPDLRIPLEIQDWSRALTGTESRIVNSALDAGGRIRGLLVSGGHTLSRKRIEAIEERVKAAGAPGLLWVKRSDDGYSGPLTRGVDNSALAKLGMVPGDLILAAAGPDPTTSPALAEARLALADEGVVPRTADHAWLWVTDFPMFESMSDGTIGANHHPFVQPHPDDLDLMVADPLSARGLAYDLVFDGMELGSGSLRNHDPDLQRRILGTLGLSEEEIDRKFGFLLSALALGAPPHGGMALGMDRIVLLFGGGTSLRDVIAFPKTTAARALFEDAPTAVTPEELAALHLRSADE